MDNDSIITIGYIYEKKAHNKDGKTPKITRIIFLKTVDGVFGVAMDFGIYVEAGDFESAEKKLTSLTNEFLRSNTEEDILSVIDFYANKKNTKNTDKYVLLFKKNLYHKSPRMYRYV